MKCWSKREMSNPQAITIEYLMQCHPLLNDWLVSLKPSKSTKRVASRLTGRDPGCHTAIRYREVSYVAERRLEIRRR